VSAPYAANGTKMYAYRVVSLVHVVTTKPSRQGRNGLPVRENSHVFNQLVRLT